MQHYLLSAVRPLLWGALTIALPLAPVQGAYAGDDYVPTRSMDMDASSAVRPDGYPRMAVVSEDALEVLNQRAREMQERVDFGRAAGKDLVIFVGPTRGGKSATVNALVGHEIASFTTQQIGDYGIVETTTYLEVVGHEAMDPRTYAAIGHEALSATSFPACYGKQEDAIAYCDLPGLGDNRDWYQLLCNGLGTGEIIASAAQVKALALVFTKSMLTEGGAAFVETLHLLQDSLSVPLEELAPSVFFLFTKEAEDPLGVYLSGLVGIARASAKLQRENPDAPLAKLFPFLNKMLSEHQNQMFSVNPLSRANSTAINEALLASPPIPKAVFDFLAEEGMRVRFRELLEDAGVHREDSEESFSLSSLVAFGEVTPLVEQCLSHQITLAELCMRLATDCTLHIDQVDAMGRTLLMWACKTNHTDLAALLIRLGADVRRCNTWQHGALWYAHNHRNTYLMEQLVHVGCTLEEEWVNISVCDAGGRNMGYWAKRYGHQATAELLEHHGLVEHLPTQEALQAAKASTQEVRKALAQRAIMEHSMRQTDIEERTLQTLPTVAVNTVVRLGTTLASSSARRAVEQTTRMLAQKTGELQTLDFLTKVIAGEAAIAGGIYGGSVGGPLGAIEGSVAAGTSVYKMLAQQTGLAGKRSAEGAARRTFEHALEQQAFADAASSMAGQAVTNMGLGAVLDVGLAARAAYQERTQHAQDETFHETYARNVAQPGEFTGKNMGSVAGSTVGFALAGPIGAFVGATVGSMAGGYAGGKTDEPRLHAAIRNAYNNTIEDILRESLAPYQAQEEVYSVEVLHTLGHGGDTPCHLFVTKLQEDTLASTKRKRLQHTFDDLIGREHLYLDVNLRNYQHQTPLDMTHDPALAPLLMSRGGITDHGLITLMMDHNANASRE